MKKYFFSNKLLLIANLETNKSYTKKELFNSLMRSGVLKVIKKKLFFKKKLGKILELNNLILKRKYMNFQVYYNYIDNMILSEDLDIYEFPIQLKLSDLKEISEITI
tara:strand:+ start:136 stop:456 length:321 start_codon:yes stop_codon:yes gene_type:complete